MKSSVKGREMAWEQHELLSLTYSRRDGRRPGWGQSWAAEGCMQHLADCLIF